MDNLDKEFKYYLANQKKLTEKYYGRYIVIKNKKVLGDFDSEQEALEVVSEKHEVGTFLIQHCVPGKESTNATFYSRVEIV
jgi:hypothetical protein